MASMLAELTENTDKHSFSLCHSDPGELRCGPTSQLPVGYRVGG